MFESNRGFKVYSFGGFHYPTHQICLPLNLNLYFLEGHAGSNRVAEIFRSAGSNQVGLRITGYTYGGRGGGRARLNIAR